MNSEHTPKYGITLSKQALKYLRKMRAADARRVRSALDRVAADPERRDLDLKPLQGRPAFRLRVGDWRIIFSRDDAIRVLAIERIGARGDVYKQ